LYTNLLYRSYRKEWHKQGKFTYDCHKANDNGQFSYDKSTNVLKLPIDAVPIDVHDAPNGWRITKPMTLHIKQQQISEPFTFVEKLMQQPPHILQYYTQVDFHTAPIRVYENYKTTSKALIATDGGAIPYKGSIGFVLADGEGNLLVSCFGQPAGHDPLSFRSEICAFLAAVKFISLLTEYYNEITSCDQKVKGQFQFYTDSLSMMKKLTAYDKYPTAPLRTVLHSEWDVLSALHRALKWFPTYSQINWVKSHQDEKIYTESDMPLNAYLNSEADELATTGLRLLQEKPLVPMDPETEIQFSIKGRTITREFKRSVREIITLQPLKTFYCRKFEWDENVFDSIDWEFFCPVYRKYIAAHGIA
jgi:hypothetical protein